MEKHGAPMPDANLASLDILGRAQALVVALLSRGHTHASIADALGGRVTPRTVYRWAKGEHAPQKQSDLVALERLAGVAAPEKSA
jgi:hypothetical protein